MRLYLIFNQESLILIRSLLLGMRDKDAIAYVASIIQIKKLVFYHPGKPP